MFPSPVTMVKSHKKKYQKYFPVIKITANDMMKCRCVKQKKMMDFDYCEEYLKTVYQTKTKYYYGSIKKSTFSFSSGLQIGKKINNVKEDPRKKTDSDFDFSQVLRLLVLIRF